MIFFASWALRHLKTFSFARRPGGCHARIFRFEILDHAHYLYIKLNGDAESRTYIVVYFT